MSSVLTPARWGRLLSLASDISSRSEFRPQALSCSLLSRLPVSPGFISSSLELESRSPPPLEIIVVVILFEEGLIFGQTGRGLEGLCCVVALLFVVSAAAGFGLFAGAALVVDVAFVGWGREIG